MGIFIKNPDVERKARELAARSGKSITAAIESAVDQALAAENAKPRGRPTIEEMRAATDRFRKAVGLDKVKLNVARADFDAMWEIPGLPDFDPDK